MAGAHDGRDGADAALAGADRDALGRTRRHDLQRRLCRVRGRTSSRPARHERARGLARGRRLQRQRHARRPRRRHPRLQRPATHALTPRPCRAGLAEPRLLAPARRRRHAGRRDGDRRRDHRQGARRAPARPRARASRPAVRAIARLHGDAERAAARVRARQSELPAAGGRSRGHRQVGGRGAARGRHAGLHRSARRGLPQLVWPSPPTGRATTRALATTPSCATSTSCSSRSATSSARSRASSSKAPTSPRAWRASSDATFAGRPGRPRCAISTIRPRSASRRRSLAGRGARRRPGSATASHRRTTPTRSYVERDWTDAGHRVRSPGSLRTCATSARSSTT